MCDNHNNNVTPTGDNTINNNHKNNNHNNNTNNNRLTNNDNNINGDSNINSNMSFLARPPPLIENVQKTAS